jgi:hypothetical protein
MARISRGSQWAPAPSRIGLSVKTSREPVETRVKAVKSSRTLQVRQAKSMLSPASQIDSDQRCVIERGGRGRFLPIGEGDITRFTKLSQSKFKSWKLIVAAVIRTHQCELRQS